MLGPMVYACAYWPLDRTEELKKMKFNDSKVLTEVQREGLYRKILSCSMGFSTNILHPRYISHSMLRLNKYNLNEMSHDTAAGLIQTVLDNGAKIKEVYVDTVGDPSSYQRKLSSRFPSIDFTVTKKADSLFPIVSAASICAKVIRDAKVKNWDFDDFPRKGLFTKRAVQKRPLRSYSESSLSLSSTKLKGSESSESSESSGSSESPPSSPQQSQNSSSSQSSSSQSSSSQSSSSQSSSSQSSSSQSPAQSPSQSPQNLSKSPSSKGSQSTLSSFLTSPTNHQPLSSKKLVTGSESPSWGSGYPGDPQTKKWLRENCDYVFGFPSIVRFSWKTASTLMKQQSASVSWGDSDEEEENVGQPKRKRIKRSQSSSSFGFGGKKGKGELSAFSMASSAKMENFFGGSDEPETEGDGKKSLKRKRSSLKAKGREKYFSDRSLSSLTDL